MTGINRHISHQISPSYHPVSVRAQCFSNDRPLTVKYATIALSLFLPLPLSLFCRKRMLPVYEKKYSKIKIKKKMKEWKRDIGRPLFRCISMPWFRH